MIKIEAIVLILDLIVLYINYKVKNYKWCVVLLLLILLLLSKIIIEY